MTELDLSLLTDAERKDSAPHLEGCVHYLPPIPDGEDMWLEQRFDMHEDERCTCAHYERTRLAAALIAARAENKRKDEVIEAARELIEIDSIVPIGSEYWLHARDHLAALLQSEKERCPVHDFEFPCLGCAKLALEAGVDEQEKSEKGGE